MAEKKTTVLVFGNPLLSNDSLPLRLMGRLRKNLPELEFKEFDPNENLEKEGRDLNIIDTVEGIRKVVLITEIESIVTQKLYSMHDFDLGYSLRLLKKLGYLDTVRIFGVPMKIGEKKAFGELSELLRSTLL